MKRIMSKRVARTAPKRSIRKVSRIAREYASATTSSVFHTVYTAIEAETIVRILAKGSLSSLAKSMGVDAQVLLVIFLDRGVSPTLQISAGNPMLLYGTVDASKDILWFDYVSLKIPDLDSTETAGQESTGFKHLAVDVKGMRKLTKDQKISLGVLGSEASTIGVGLATTVFSKLS